MADLNAERDARVIASPFRLSADQFQPMSRGNLKPAPNTYGCCLMSTCGPTELDEGLEINGSVAACPGLTDWLGSLFTAK